MGSINAASQKEDVTTQFKVLLGDLEAAKYLYQEINQYAAVSPFETAGLAENTKTLIAMGMSAKAAFTDLKMLGDVALGDQNKLNRMALTYGQVMSLGRLQGDNLREFALQGWNPLTYWQAKSGKSMEQLRKDMEKGLITAAMVQEALQAATAQGGKFYKGAEEGSKTWSGMMSTLRDNVRMLGAELGEMLLPTLKAILTAFGSMWDIVAGSFRSMAVAMGIFLEQGPGVISIAGAIAAAFSTVADVIMLAMTTFQFFYALLDSISSVVAVFAASIVDVLALIGKTIANMLGSIFGAVGSAGEFLGNKAMAKFGKTQAASMQGMVGGYEFGDFVKGTAIAGVESAGEKWGTFRDIGQMIGTETEGAPAMKMTDKIDKILSGMSLKQPVTNITQNNNLTVNAEDPIKTMGESAAARFFQGAFIELRHATV
jgi:tape measure domain-containing protein